MNTPAIRTIRKPLFTLFVILFSFQTLQAQKAFDFNVNCKQAYHATLSLRLDAAAKLLMKEKENNPDNLVPYFIENYIDFFTLFFNEDPAEIKQKSTQKAKRLALMKQGPANSPLTLFTQSVIHLQWAVIDIKLGNKLAAGWAFRDAFKSARQNQTKFPDFKPNLMITGPMEMAASTIPSNLKWLGNLMGIKGTMAGGKVIIDRFLQADDSWSELFMNEGVFYTSFMQFHLLNKPDEVLQLIRSRKLDLVNNHLFTYMAASLYMSNRESEKAFNIISKRNKSAEYLPTPVWDFLAGCARLYQLQPDAKNYLENYLKDFKGNTFIKDGWNKLAWNYLIHGNEIQYKKSIAQVLSKGNTQADADKQALKEVKKGVRPNLNLLKARLLSDGGYHQQALAILATLSSKDFSSIHEKLEYTYRLGRIYDDLNRMEPAIQCYTLAYEIGIQRTEYFAARAALQIGMLYEKHRQFNKANDWYKKCIALEKHDYEDALEQKAKAGMQRCGR